MQRNKKDYLTICADCEGRGNRKQRIRKNVRLRYKIAVSNFETNQGESAAPVFPKSKRTFCKTCNGSGLIPSAIPPAADRENYPHVAIIGGGIGGTALAVACYHRGIPFTLYERDTSFNDRPQGYGLTLQQASKAIKGFGLFSLEKGVISTRHIIHTTEGKIIGEWGTRKWLESVHKPYFKQSNVHIPRQSLRMALFDQLDGNTCVQWGHELIDFSERTDGEIELTFKKNGNVIHAKANLLVGADGIRSTIRKLLIGEETSPLRYLDCIVILGICSLENLNHDLLDNATVFQTANGTERIYIMPFTSDSVMWQLSFPMTEKDAKELGAKGAHALKEEACRRIQWHDPIPQILAATKESQITGYPVYDRAVLDSTVLGKSANVTLLGDAAHPMSPFKGQGANQALLDALALARGIYKGCKPFSQWRERGIRESVLNGFEAEMLERSAIKVKDSAQAAEVLHSENILLEGDGPRGRLRKK